MKQITVKEAVDWILKNRKNKAFRYYSPDTIAMEIIHAIKQNVFTYSFDSHGKLNGIVCGEVRPNNEICIMDILTTEKGVVKKFMKIFNELHPNSRIIGHVRDRVRVFYDPNKLERRLM